MIKTLSIAGCFFLLFSTAVLAKEEQRVIPSVTIAPPIVKPVTEYLDLTGHAQAAQVADLVARVPGYLQAVHFKDGSDVKKGDLLFTIEQDSYKQQLKLNSAKLQQAQSEYTRQQTLIRQNATSEANLEKYLSDRDQASANEALAKINLGYTEVRAPFNGRIGRKLVDVGNYVGSAGATKLATIEQITPIYVYFNVNERDVLRIMQSLKEQGIKPGGAIGKAPVLIGLQNEKDYPHKGTLDYVGSDIDKNTGTMEIRAIFPNQDRNLLSGSFARVRIPLGRPQEGVLIPDSAIQRDQSGFFVLLVGDDNIARRQAITIGSLSDGLRVVTEGLTKDQNIIIKGISNAGDGQKVAAEKSVITRDTKTSATPIKVNAENN